MIIMSIIKIFCFKPIVHSHAEKKMIIPNFSFKGIPIIQQKTNLSPASKGLTVGKNQAGFELSNSFIDKLVAREIKNTGDKFANEDNFNKAIYYYEKAIEKKPDYPAPYYNLAKAHEKNGNPDQTIKTYLKLLKVKPDEVEAQTLLGECYEGKGDYEKARQMYEKAAKTDPKYDFAARSLKKVDYLILRQENPEKAEKLKNQTSKKNLSKALLLVQQHASPDLARVLDKVKITFNKTDSLSGHKNIAQYEHHKEKIVITDEYIWATPEITAAYIIHETVHAKDKDGISSIREEQDAYAESIKFWISHNNGVKDPELDYAAELYKENPQKLREKVGETYRTRDASMPQFSPYHTPREGVDLITTIKIQALKIGNKVSNMTGLS